MKKILVLVMIIGTVVVAGYFSANAYLDHKARSKIENALGNLVENSPAKYRVGDVDYKMFSQDVVLSDITVDAPKFENGMSISKVLINDYKKSKGEMTAKFDMDGIKLGNASLPKRMKELDYENLYADLDVDVNYSTSKGVLDVNNMFLEIENLGNLGVEFHLSNIPDMESVDSNPKNPMVLLSRVADIKLKEAHLNFTDDSFTKRYMQLMAKKAGLNYRDYIDRELKKMDRYINYAGNKAAKDVLKSVKKFVKERGMLALSVKPDDPVSFSQLTQVQKARIPEVLNFDASTS